MRHVSTGNAESLTGRGKAVDLIFEECCGILDVGPAGVADDLGCLDEVIQNIGDIPKSLFVLFEDKLRIDGQVQSANEVGQLFIVLNDTEQVNKVTVVVVQDFSLCTRFSEEDFRTSHTRFNVDDVLRHDSQDRVDDATLISCVGQRACRCRQ